MRPGKYNVANLEGTTVAVELGRWLAFVSAASAYEPDFDTSKAQEFMRDGGTCYLAHLQEIHDGVKVKRKLRKASRAWVDHSIEAREELRREAGPDALDTFDLPMPHPRQILGWVVNGTLVPFE
jgi:hypothetical protein